MQIDALLVELAVSVAFTFLIWRYYKGRAYLSGQKYATFWPRFWTGSVDYLVFFPLQTLILFVLSVNHGVVAVVFLVIQQLAAWVYSVGMHAKYGQTVGKMVCKVKIVDAKTEAPIGFRQAFLRDAIPIVLTMAMLPSSIKIQMNPASLPSDGNGTGYSGWMLGVGAFWFLLEVLTMLTNDKRRALHDFIAGTVVIRTNLSEAVATA